MTDLRDQIRRTLLVDARPDTAGVDGTADAIMALLKQREDRAMNDDALREKIVPIARDLVWAGIYIGKGNTPGNDPDARAQATQEGATAIMTLIAPALREARVAALREAEGIARERALKWVNREASTAYGQAFQAGCRSVADAIAALIAEETAP